MDWQKAVEGYWLEKRKVVSKATVDDYSGTFRRFAEYHGDELPPFEYIGAVHVRAYLTHIRDSGRSAKSALNAWVALSSLWTWAEKELETPHVIRGRVARPKYKRPPIEPYSRSEVNAMLHRGRAAAWTSKHGRHVEERRDTAARDRAILVVLLDTGIRASELCDLVVEDYDTKNGRLHIRDGKGNKGRFVWLGEAARKAIWRYQAERGDAQPTDPLFATRSNQPLDRNNLRHAIERCAKRRRLTQRHTSAIHSPSTSCATVSVLELQRLRPRARGTLRIYVTADQTCEPNAKRRPPQPGPDNASS